MSTSLLGVGGTEQTEEGSPGTVHTGTPDLPLSPLSLEASAPDWSLPRVTLDHPEGWPRNHLAENISTAISYPLLLTHHSTHNPSCL